MIVYRIENEDGYGPYHLSSAEWCEGSHTTQTGHPVPEDDMITNLSYGTHRFGFESMDKLMQWFTFVELSRLYDQGFRIATFEVDIRHTIIGGKQVVFVKEHAREITERCPKSELNYLEAA